MFDALQVNEQLLALYKAMDEMDEPTACTNFPDAFYPEKGASGAAQEIVWAKESCAACPVRQLCAEYALNNEEHGIWGGMAANERRDLRRQLKIVLPDRDAA